MKKPSRFKPSFRKNDANSDKKPALKTAIFKTKGPSPIPKQAPGTFPMRINKYLAMKGHSTRRDADTLVAKKFVIINGRIAQLGDKVEATDAVEVRRNGRLGRGTRSMSTTTGTNEKSVSNKSDNAAGAGMPTYVYYAFNKPAGVQLEVAARALPLQNVFPVLSLDREARGLVILTNDRRIIDRLTSVSHPGTAAVPASAASVHVADNARMKEYLVRTHNPLKHNFKEKLEKGVVLTGSKNGRHPVHFTCTVHVIKDNVFTLHTTDNGNHIRHVCALFMAEVADLARTKIGNLGLGGITPGQFRSIEGEEKEIFLKELGL